MLERTDAIMNEVLEPITFVLVHPTVYIYIYIYKVKQSRYRPGVVQRTGLDELLSWKSEPSRP
jgi:hypothetical protein